MPNKGHWNPVEISLIYKDWPGIEMQVLVVLLMTCDTITGVCVKLPCSLRAACVLLMGKRIPLASVLDALSGLVQRGIVEKFPNNVLWIKDRWSYNSYHKNPKNIKSAQASIELLSPEAWVAFAAYYNITDGVSDGISDAKQGGKESNTDGVSDTGLRGTKEKEKKSKKEKTQVKKKENNTDTSPDSDISGPVFSDYVQKRAGVLHDLIRKNLAYYKLGCNLAEKPDAADLDCMDKLIRLDKHSLEDFDLAFRTLGDDWDGQGYHCIKMCRKVSTLRDKTNAKITKFRHCIEDGRELRDKPLSDRERMQDEGRADREAEAERDRNRKPLTPEERAKSKATLKKFVDEMEVKA